MQIVDRRLLGRWFPFRKHLDEAGLVRADTLGLPHGVLPQAVVLHGLVDEGLRHCDWLTKLNAKL